MFCVTVSIKGSYIYFRGFIIQAIDPKTKKPIGSFQATEHTKVDEKCSSITHTDAKDKQEAYFIWNAPQHQSGKVEFT